MKEKKENLIGSAPFNMALATLEAIRKAIDSLLPLSVCIIEGRTIPLAQAQHIKYKTVEFIYILAVPLLNKENREEIQKELNKVPTKTQTIGLDTIPIYNPEAERILNKILVNLQIKLQEENYFMPSKRDPHHSWRQSGK